MIDVQLFTSTGCQPYNQVLELLDSVDVSLVQPHDLCRCSHIAIARWCHHHPFSLLVIELQAAIHEGLLISVACFSEVGVRSLTQCLVVCIPQCVYSVYSLLGIGVLCRRSMVVVEYERVCR